MPNSETDSQPLRSAVDFTDTRIAFAHKSNQDLRLTAWMFRFMNKQSLVNAASGIALWLNENGIHIFNPLIRATFFKQFCGGRSLQDSQEAVDHLKKHNTLAVLDYGAEGKTKEEEFDQTLEETIKAIRFAGTHPSVPVVATKITALAPFELLEKFQSATPLTRDESAVLERVYSRLDLLCQESAANHVALFVDAEETWIQDTIDSLVVRVMEKYNRQRPVVYQTYQMYRKDKLEGLKRDHQEAVKKGYILGAKVVRGAYMEKERKRALEMGYPSPIQDSKVATDKDFNAAITYCLDHYSEIASCNATHNIESNQLLVDLITQREIPKDHPHLNFCQLYGMSDNITFNLAAHGFNVAKIVPYGPVKEVVPYLIRRARENTSVTGEMSRELRLITKEMKRRGMKY